MPDVSEWLRDGLGRLRDRLSQREALPQLAALGAIVGLLSGAAIVLFRLLIKLGEQQFLAQTEPASFSGTPILLRLLLPIIGSLLLAWLFRKPVQTGVVHVMERLAYHQGRLPIRNAVQQFIGAAVAILSGHSVGREGPSVHLGAAVGSLGGQRLDLPNNSIRTLVGCGVAAAIGASFNTPLAGVIFAVEVVMLEYSVVSLAPIILSSVFATAVARAAFGSELAFDVPAMGLATQTELPYLVFCGLVIGTLAGGFIRAVEWLARRGKEKSVLRRFLAVGVVTGVCGAVLPQCMGVGYDAVNTALADSMGLKLALALLVLKFLTTSFAVALGIPGGVIGPSLVIGAAAGTVLGLGGGLLTDNNAGTGFYALMGMVAMMGATLQAPLAALIAMLELTGNPHVLMPGMLVVITAMVTTRQLFGADSLFMSLMHLRGLDYRSDPLTQHLRSIGVHSRVDTAFRENPRELDLNSPACTKSEPPRWWLVPSGKTRRAILVAGADVERALAARRQEIGEFEANEERDPEAIAPTTVIDLLEIPAQRLTAVPVRWIASLNEALEAIERRQAEAVYVTSRTQGGQVRGVLTREMIRESYR